MTRPGVVVMAKAPRPGHAKTRLEPLLGRDGCARLQSALIAHTSRWARDVAPGGWYLACDPPGAVEEVRPLMPAGGRLIGQEGADLGERLQGATRRLFADGRRPVIVVGTDQPTLGRSHARQALEALAGGADAVFGPALDGGYYLVALARPLPGLFGLPPEAWGGAEVLALSLRLAARAGLRCSLIAPERDLDTADDVRAVAGHPAVPPAVAALLREPARA